MENAVKYTSRQTSFPWRIEVNGSADDSSWKISVVDNGPGFSEEDLRSIKEKIRIISETGLFPNLELNGMGLLNVFIRLKLLYKDKYIFRIENHAPNGAAVTIGAYEIPQSNTLPEGDGKS